MTAGRGRVAVTGGTGFLGPYIVAALIEAGWTVRLLVRPATPCRLAGVETVTGNLADPVALDRLVDGADVVVHAAGAIKARSRRDFLAVNRDGSALLAQAVRRSNAAMKVVVVSSLAARQPELSDYAFSKAAGEQAFRHEALSNLTILRPAAVYGPGDRETASWLRTAFGPVVAIPRAPDARLCLVHAADVAAAVAACCLGRGEGATYEVSDERVDGYGWRELAETAIRAAGGNGAIVSIPQSLMRAVAWGGALAARLRGRASMVCPGKMREILHPDWASARDRQLPPSLWRPTRRLHDGLSETLRGLRPATTKSSAARAHEKGL